MLVALVPLSAVILSAAEVPDSQENWVITVWASVVADTQAMRSRVVKVLRMDIECCHIYVKRSANSVNRWLISRYLTPNLEGTDKIETIFHLWERCALVSFTNRRPGHRKSFRGWE